MFRILTTLAALAALAGGAQADDHTAGADDAAGGPTEDASVREVDPNAGEPPFSTTTVQYGDQYLATTLIGTAVYATQMELDPMQPLEAGTVAEWDRIGEIGDMIIGVEGTLEAVVLDIGGFLGVGAREVALDWSALVGVREDDDEDEWFLAVNLTQETLAEAPALERVPPEQE
jgi:hypothetical protein